MAGNDLAVLAREPDFLGLGDQVADGQHEPVVAYDDAAAFPQRAQWTGREGVFRNGGAQCNDGLQDCLGVHAFGYPVARAQNGARIPETRYTGTLAQGHEGRNRRRH